VRSLARSQPSEEHTHLLYCILVWTSLRAVQEAVGQDYVIMWRQKASDVVFPDDVETIRRDLEEGCKQLQGFRR
jgi:RNase P protein component